MTRMLTGVGGVLSCAHEAINADIFGGELHGHSYEVTAWFHNDEGADARVFQASLNTLLRLWDHKVLPPEMATAEGIARAVGTLGKCVEVEVRRPLERLHARWIASVDGRRMAETENTGSGRSPTSAVAATSGETPNSHSEAPDNG